MYNNLHEAIRSHIANFETQLYTALPATVVSWDAEAQTITASPVMLEAYEDGDISKLPEIDHVPVMFPSGGGGSLTFPIQVGDEVLLVFSSRSFDTWWSTGEVDKLSSTQRYNEYTDAVAIVGITSKDKSVKAHTTDVELKFKDNAIRLVEDSSVVIHTGSSSMTMNSDGTIDTTVKDTWSLNNGSEEFVTVLSETLQAIADITTPTMMGPQPIINKPAILALKSRLDSFKK